MFITNKTVRAEDLLSDDEFKMAGNVFRVSYCGKQGGTSIGFYNIKKDFVLHDMLVPDDLMFKIRRK